MKPFVNERSIPGASALGPEDLADIARTSNAAVESLGVPYTWVLSYVAGSRFYCVHETEDVSTVLEHARRGGFPADLVCEVATVIGPHTADQARTSRGEGTP